MIYDQIINILMVAFGTEIVRLYFQVFCWKRRNPHKTRWAVWLLYVVFQIIIMIYNASHPLAILIINILLAFLICKLTYDVEFKLAVFLAGTLYVVWMLVEVATNYALTLTGVALQENGFIVGVIISKIVMYILLLIMSRYTKADYMANLPFKYWLSLFTVPVVTIFIIHNSFMITVGSDRSVFFFTSTVLLIWVNYMIFDVYNRLGKQMIDDRRLLIYEQQLKICEQQANTREQAYQETARLRHDLKQYLLTLFTDIEAKDYDLAQGKIQELLDRNQIYRQEVVHSGNICIDALLSYKHAEAVQKKIKAEYEVSVIPELPFERGDLCVILGNLLDNAIEAASKVENSEKWMRTQIQYNKGCILIVIENACNDKFINYDHDRYMTTKSDKAEHGIGLESVRYTVEKYHGTVEIEKKESIFKVTVFMYAK